MGKQIETGDKLVNPFTQEVLTVDEVFKQGSDRIVSAKTEPTAKRREELSMSESWLLSQGYTIKQK